MKITVERFARKANYTIGRLYIDGNRICNTLEDTDRGLHQGMPLKEISAKKVYGKTAIPTGKYKVGIHKWAKHDIFVPILKEVPGFTGILIHNGVDESHTLGCILVGENKIVGKLVNGRKWMEYVTREVSMAIANKDEVTIEIR